jgi:hypothetical protein
MRLTAAVFSIAILAPASALAFGVVNLDEPGALDAVKRDNPDHHRRVTGILAAASEMQCRPDKVGRLSVEYDAREAHCGVLVMTSYPAKRKLSFVLDTTAYRATVTLATRDDKVRKVGD